MMEGGEEPAESLARELREETGLTVEVGRLYAVRGGQRVLILFFEVAVTGGKLRPFHESLEVAWFPIPAIPWEDLAFSRHRDVLRE
jgi:8-oxo-dGTP diphosphatase